MDRWANFHSHTHYCDGTAAPEEYVREAVRMGLPAYGFTSHAPVLFPTDWNIADDKLNDYLSDIQSLKKKYDRQIQIYLGLEIDFIPGIAGRRKNILENVDLDYFIGSIHFVESLPSGEYWNIDTSPELFQQGLLEIFKNDFRKAATRFWEITRQMIEEDKPDIVGHLDKIKMFNKENCYFSESESWYTDQVELTLDLIKNRGCIVEINTRGFYRYGQTDLYPGEWVIRRLSEKGIPIMINSDAHKPSEITEGMGYAAKILKGLGHNKLVLLYYKQWREYSFSEKGIDLQSS